ncbi:hypothetical protein KC721_01815 [Candidatus Woesebacteria bacterium]|nr:hypothetical protein [Candidatus Woesebacteria bacterium]
MSVSDPNTTLHGHGRTIFVAKKIAGFHRYYAHECNGNMIFTVEGPNKDPFTFQSFFDKHPSSNDYISVSFTDLFFKRYIIIKPMFKEYVADHVAGGRSHYDHVLYGITKVHSFPYPNFGQTLYCYKKENNDELIPVGYCIYQ